MEMLVRARLDRLASALRRFGLTDRFGIGGLLRDAEVPSVAVIQSRLSRVPGELPAGVSPRYLAEFLHREIVADEHAADRHDVLVETVRQLARIKPGTANATRYHDTIVKILNLLFLGELAFEKKEAPLFSGRKRIDILYRNVAHDGVFRALSAVHKIHCAFIPVECKNYSEDPGNPEFDQLAMRLKPDVGRVGILVCRTIGETSSARRCIDAKQDNKFLLVVCDHDIERMASQRASGAAVTVLDEKVRSLMLG